MGSQELPVDEDGVLHQRTVIYGANHRLLHGRLRVSLAYSGALHLDHVFKLGLVIHRLSCSVVT